jgi:PAS domain S-box-containing protein
MPPKHAKNPGIKTGAVGCPDGAAEARQQPGCLDLLDALPFYVLLVDEHHNIIMANRAVAAQLGVKPAEIIGRYCPEVIHGTKGPWYACPLEQAVSTNEAVVIESLDKTTGRWINSAMYPVPGQPPGRRIFFHMVTDITDRKESEERLKASRQELRDLSRHLETVREEERSSIAREIHDELGQTLVTLKIYISWLLKQTGKVGEDQTKPIYALVDSAINTVMRLSTELRPAVLDDLGLVAAVEWQINEFKKWTALEYHFISRPARIILDKESSTALFRIAHEAITNIIRHAGATRVDILLQKKRGSVELTISDNGRGIADAEIHAKRSFGLIGMVERAHLIGGEVHIEGKPGSGTVVKVILPIPAKQ